MPTVKKIDLTEGLYPTLSGVPNHIGAVLEIDLTAVSHNYHFLKDHLTSAQCGAVVKADAYGLGL
ncbi:MAG: alanine racemase, partial [Alphaproteobacteria bacterium]|nr:alanine racemase [Alphaproteobacteria bacterium]